MLETQRLLLRQWVENDFHSFAEICADKEVMKFFPKTLSSSESYKMAKQMQSLINQRGWGFWAVEIPTLKQFIGFVGLHTPKVEMPFSPCVEIGWRLSKKYWGQGYATEAATAVLQYAFNELELREVVSFTTRNNIRSIAVMERIGMLNTYQNFSHPDISSSHPLSEHVLYKISQSNWKQRAL